MNPITATDRAAQINAATEALAGAGNISFYGLLSTDPTYWADCGVHTGAELDRLLAYEDYIETYKERYNIKPRRMQAEDHTAEAWRQMAEAV
jgi:hypothetical protein